MNARAHFINLLALLAVVVAVGGAAPPAAAQEAPRTRIITIVNADSVAGEVVDGERLRRLIGNVHLRQDTTDLRANRAIQYIDRDLILFEGNVTIADPSDTLRARRVSYDSAARVGRAQGDVRLSDAEAVLTSDSLVYFRAEKRAVFEAPVQLVEREGGGVLTSLRGTYFTDRSEALFQGDVQLVDSTTMLTSDFGRYGTRDKRADFIGEVRLAHGEATRLRADTLTHFRDTEVSEARGDVVLKRFGERDNGAEAAPDTTRRTLLFGGFVFHDERARYSRVERGGQPHEPLVARLTTDPEGVTDTLLVRSRLFEAFQPDTLDGRALPPGATLQRVFGRGDVHLTGPQLAALADSVVFDRLEFEAVAGAPVAEPTPAGGAPPPAAAAPPPVRDDIRLFVEPRAWLNARGSQVFTQLTADTLRVSARAEALDSLHAVGRAFAVRPDSALDRLNQIRGRRLLAVFREDSLRAIRVWPVAEALFFRADTLGQLEGAIRLGGDSLSFAFRGDDLHRMSGVRGVEGTYYEAALVPEPFRLEGLAYEPERRPSRQALLEGRAPLADPFGAPPPVLPPPDLPPPPAALATPPPAAPNPRFSARP